VNASDWGAGDVSLLTCSVVGAAPQPQSWLVGLSL
jgi:hypothetical protein